MFRARPFLLIPILLSASNIRFKARRLPLFFLNVSLIFSTAQADSLAEVVASVIEENPRVRSWESAVEAATAELDLARAASLPQFSLRLSSGEEVANTPLSRSTLGGDSTEYSDQGSLVLTQNLFNGYKNVNSRKSAMAAKEANEQSAQMSREALALDVANYYLDVLQYEALALITQQSAQQHEVLAQRIRDRNQNNVSSSTDLSLAQSRVYLVNARRLEFEGLLSAARGRYREYLGLEPADLQLPSPRNLATELDAGTLVERIRNSNPQVQASYHNYENFRFLSEASKSRFYPRIDLEISGNYRNQSARQSLIQQGGREADSYIGLRVSYDIYMGGANRATRQRTFHQSEQARFDWLETVSSVSSETLSLLDSIRGTEAALAQQRQYLLQLTAVSQAYQEQFDVNLRAALNLLDQEVELYRAQIDTVNMEFDLLRMMYRLAYNSGQLLDVIHE